jgi:glyoxylase-like metal-dependent hydrolase (beta-lactamase superfamily II)
MQPSDRRSSSDEGIPPAAAGPDVVQGLVAPNAGPLTLDGTRTWLVGRDRVLLIDPGPDDERHVGDIRRSIAGRPVDGILLTHAHADHSASASLLSGELGAPILASSSTLARLNLPGRVLADGDAVPVSAGGPSRSRLQVVETPGHSADHLSFLLLPQRWLFTGDLVLGSGSSAVLHPDGRVGDYIGSIRKLEALRPARLFPGHGPEVSDAAAKLEEYRLHRLERQRQIEMAVAEGLSSVAAIRRAVYGDLAPGLAMAAEASISAHLLHLAELGIDAPEPGAGMFEESALNRVDDAGS